MKLCTFTKCEIGSCAVCHCCGKDLCLDHLKEHRDLLNAQLVPLAHQVNILMENLDRFEPNSTPAYRTIEQWRQQSHQMVDAFCQKMYKRALGDKKEKSKEQIQTIHTSLDQVLRRQGATRENIDSITKLLNSAQQRVNELSTIQINLRPLAIDEKSVIAADPTPTPNENR